jgi:cytochrome c peroxidase
MPVKSQPTVLILALVTACGGSGTTAPGNEAGQFPGVQAALNLDLDRLPDYASPPWPVHYDVVTTATDNSPATNPITDRGATLGRVLFYDRQLSLTNTVSCASCHQQGTGFTDEARFSLGFDGTGQTTAHAMRLLNARFYGPGQAFWDRRARSLEAQSTEPIQHPVEMGFDPAHGGLDALIRKMQALPYYPELFSFVYGDVAITENRIQLALAQYVRSLVSTASRFDQAYAQVFNPQLPDRGLNQAFPGFTAQENRGKQLFLQPPPQGGAGCAGCHVPPTFALAGNSRSNGLDADETRVFKSPSLKSVAVTGPYMHDGRFASLAAVVEHYVNGVQDGPALDNRLRGPGGAPQRLPLSETDRAALVAFMRTLTDDAVAADPKFSDPFRR